MSYDPNFYNIIRHGAVVSADAVVPYVYEQVKPVRVVDVGCGEGHWGKKFEDLGCYVVGMDGSYMKTPVVANFLAFDIEQRIPVPQAPYDLAICLEVAEHLQSTRAETFVEDLCRLAPTILFSAAIPGQGGNGHINCQWPTYWEKFFNQNGYTLNGSIRDLYWDDETIEPWYRQNLMIASKTPENFPELFKSETNLNRVHPVIASWNADIRLP